MRAIGDDRIATTTEDGAARVSVDGEVSRPRENIQTVALASDEAIDTVTNSDIRSAKIIITLQHLAWLKVEKDYSIADK